MMVGAQNVLADDYYNLEIDQSGIKTAQGSVNVAGTMTVQSGSTYDIVATTSTVTGTSTIAGAINIDGSGVYDGNGDFAASGSITMDGTARLQLSAAGSGVSSLGTLDNGAGTVEYDGGVQNVLADDYYNLEIDQSGIKTAQGSVNVAGTMTVQSGSTYDIVATTSTVIGTSTIVGTIAVSTGTYNADGEFDATGGNVTFTDAGALVLSNTVTDLGTFIKGTSTVTYDEADAQAVDNVDYHHLVISGGATKTLGGTTNVGGDLTVTATGTILDVNTRTLDVNGTSAISSSGKVTISTGTYDADGIMNCTASLEFTDDGALNLSNTVTALGSFTKGTSTVTYDEADAQSVDNVTYHHLILDQNGTKTAAGNLVIDGNLTFTNSATLEMDDANNRDIRFRRRFHYY